MTSTLAAVLCGTGLAAGLLCLWSACWETPDRRARRPRFLVELEDDLVAAGFPRVSPGGLAAASLLAAVVVGLVGFAFTASVPVSACFSVFAAAAPLLVVRRQARGREVERRVLWPDAIDHLGSGVRAGMSLPEAMAALAHRGPEGLRPFFGAFEEEYRATGSFRMALEAFKRASADPVADRIVAALAVTRDVGGTELGTLLRTLSHFLREDARTRSELRARQSWTVTGARLAVGAPWLVLALLSTRGEAAAAYSTPGGIVLLLTGMVVSLAAYRLMKRIGRLPAEPRVLR
ncbi:type II secretion system F family protein [Brevibacterium album]|uniref:type II secretion system F family protein n=1 Tax=Brevibacterium album TaxID=417948 RepID=UPI0003F85D1C|nr:type II secretion system F family protein [Brevibacterium album]